MGTGPTEAEEEETRKLEEEMAATRAKWGAATTTTAPPTSGGLSLASLMKAAAGESSTGPTASNVAQRWKPAEPTASPHKLKSNSAPVMTFGTANNVFSQQPITPPTVAQSTFKPTPALPSLVPTPAPKPVLAASPLPSPSVVAPAAPQWKPIAITPGGAAARRGVSPQRATTAPVRPVSPVKPLPTPQASPPLIPTANKPTSSSPAPIRRIATTAPPHPSSADNSKPTTPFRVSPISTPSSSTPRSLAAMFGSTASGPRLNSQAPQSHVEDDNSTGPQHARPGLGLGGVALPGMSAVPSGTVRARAQSFTNGGIKDVVNGATSTPLAPANLSTRPTPSPSVVDVAGAPEPEQQEDEDAEILSSPEIETAGTPEIEALHFSSTPTSPVVPSQHFEDENHHLVDQHSSASTTTTMPTYPTASLNRLQQSNIVAERLKWGEEQTKKDGLNEEGKIAPASPSKQRGNVLSRWGRDVPNVVETTSTTASPVVARSSPPTTAPSSPWGAQVGGKLAERWGEKKDVGDEGMEKSSPKTVETSPKVAEVEVQQKVESPKIESPQVPEPVAAATPVEEEQEKVVIPTTSPLVHVGLAVVLCVARLLTLFVYIAQPQPSSTTKVDSSHFGRHHLHRLESFFHLQSRHDLDTLSHRRDHLPSLQLFVLSRRSNHLSLSSLDRAKSHPSFSYHLVNSSTITTTTHHRSFRSTALFLRRRISHRTRRVANRRTRPQSLVRRSDRSQASWTELHRPQTLVGTTTSSFSWSHLDRSIQRTSTHSRCGSTWHVSRDGSFGQVAFGTR